MLFSQIHNTTVLSLVGIDNASSHGKFSRMDEQPPMAAKHIFFLTWLGP